MVSNGRLCIYDFAAISTRLDFLPPLFFFPFPSPCCFLRKFQWIMLAEWPFLPSLLPSFLRCGCSSGHSRTFNSSFSFLEKVLFLDRRERSRDAARFFPFFFFSFLSFFVDYSLLTRNGTFGSRGFPFFSLFFRPFQRRVRVPILDWLFLSFLPLSSPPLAGERTEDIRHGFQAYQSFSSGISEMKVSDVIIGIFFFFFFPLFSFTLRLV